VTGLTFMFKLSCHKICCVYYHADTHSTSFRVQCLNH